VTTNQPFSPEVRLATTALTLGYYLVARCVRVLDAAVEACFHERLTRPMDAAAIAATFD